MNMQMGISEQASNPAARGGGQNTVRYLYIVSRGGNAHSEQIFAAMRRDMAGSAAVELMYDRRTEERRARVATVEEERRARDRRRYDATQVIASVGWARVQVD